MSAGVRARLHLRVQRALSREDAAHAPLARQIRRWAAAAMRTGQAEVAVRLVGKDEGRSLNRDYRGKDYATNVLAFVYDDGGAMPGLPERDTLRGDLVLCVPVAVREAAEQGKALEAHFAHLIVHGILHLRGFDHEDDAGAQLMEAVEREMMAALGFPDPYADDGA